MTSSKSHSTENRWDVSGGGHVMRQVMSERSRMYEMRLEEEMRKVSMVHVNAMKQSSKEFGEWLSVHHERRNGCPKRKVRVNL